MVSEFSKVGISQVQYQTGGFMRKLILIMALALIAVSCASTTTKKTASDEQGSVKKAQEKWASFSRFDR